METSSRERSSYGSLKNKEHLEDSPDDYRPLMLSK